VILALAGGVGGAKLAHGLTRILPPDELLIAVNTGDDFEHLGLHISPDLDSVMYKLAGLNDTERGWGLAGETWGFMAALDRLGGETWFNLGDQDLATHLERTRRLTVGETLSEVTRTLCRKLGIDHRVVPLSDDPVRTMVTTNNGLLPFQDYFVRLRCEPVVSGFSFEGAETARPNDTLLSALTSSTLTAIVLCPSNPFVSIDPFFALPAVSSAIESRAVPVVAVSPIIGGAAVKGPAAKMFGELGMAPSAAAIAAHYGTRIDGLVIDNEDSDLAGAIEETGTKVQIVATLMRNAEEERRLAADTLAFAEALEPKST
jgi:LPPG:FO 2-phospho-L-lactate transferase